MANKVVTIEVVIEVTDEEAFLAKHGLTVGKRLRPSRSKYRLVDSIESLLSGVIEDTVGLQHKRSTVDTAALGL